MTITVAKLKRALEETQNTRNLLVCESDALEEVIQSPTLLTILAEKLSERPPNQRDDPFEIAGRADNARYAAERMDDAARQKHQDAKLGTPTSYIARADCPTALGDVCRQGQRCCQRNPGMTSTKHPTLDERPF